MLEHRPVGDTAAVAAKRVARGELLPSWQERHEDFGACDQHGRRYVRSPAEDEPLDPAWRPIDLARDSFEGWAAEDRTPWPDDHSVLCWQLPTFWRRNRPATP